MLGRVLWTIWEAVVTAVPYVNDDATNLSETVKCMYICDKVQSIYHWVKKTVIIIILLKVCTEPRIQKCGYPSSQWQAESPIFPGSF